MIKKLHTTSYLALLAFVVLLMMPGKGWGQTTRYWKGSGTWTSSNQWALTSGGTYNTTWVSNDVAVFDVASSTVTFASTGVTSITANQNVTFTTAGTLTTNGTQIPISVASGMTLNLSGQNFSTVAGTGIIKNGTGTLNIGAQGNAYPGGFTLNTGTVIVGGTNALGSPGALTINGGILAPNSSTARDFSGKFNTGGIIFGGDFQFGDAVNVSAGTGALTFSNSVALGATTRAITIGGTATYTLGGIISGTSSAGLTVNSISTGILLLTGVNTYPGATTVTSGVLKLNPSGNLSMPGACTFNGGTLTTTGITSARTITFSSINISDNSTLALLASTDHRITFTNKGTFTAGKTLTITGWTGSYVLGTTGAVTAAGKVFIGSSASLTPAELSQIKFNNGTNNYYASQLSTGEIIPTTQLVVSAIGNQTAGVGFNVTVTTKDSDGNARALTNATGITLSTATGGTIAGTTTGTINAAASTVTISGVTLTAGTSQTITATRSSGDMPLAGTSAAFDVAASSLLTPPTLSADATANTVDNNIDITFSPNSAWEAAINAVKIGGTALTLTTDYVVSSGNIQLKPSGGNSLLTSPGSKEVTVEATGYTAAAVTQQILAGAPSANSTATINIALAPGLSRTITCTAKDQFNNLVTGYTFKYDAAITNNDATTAESYTLDGTARTTTTNDISFVSTTNASGVATFTAALPAIIDGNDGISIQVQLSNGSTNIGSVFSFTQLLTQTITFGSLTPVTYGDAPITVSASGGGSGNPVIFTSSDAAVATCSGTNGATVTIIGPGNCTINANQAGNSSYNAALQVGQSLLVNTKALTLPDAAAQNKVYTGTNPTTITGTLTGIISPDVVTYTGTGTFADVNVANGIAVSSTSTLGGANAAKYTLTQPLGLTANITQATQSITFSALPVKTTGDANFDPGATSATSGTNPITYSSSNTSVATIVSGLIHIIAAGTSTITASQAGSTNYQAASDVQQTLTVNLAPIAAWDFFGQSSPSTFAATTFSSYLVSTSSASNITRGSTAAASSGSNSFRTVGFQNEGISTTNTDYFQITLAPTNGYKASLFTIDAHFIGTQTFVGTGGVTSQFAYSLNGTDFTLIGSPEVLTGTVPLTMTQIDLTGVSALQNVAAGTTITLRYYASGQTTTGGWGFSSSSAGTNGLAIGGSVFQPIGEPTNHPTNFTAASNTTTSIVLSWTDATGAQLPQNYLIKAAVSPASPTAPADFTAEANSALVHNVAQGVGTYTFTGLTTNTTYNFSIWPYTNSSTSIDYKTNGTVPTTTATTGVATWSGASSTEWNTAANWSTGIVPSASTNVSIPNVTNDPVVNQAPATPAECHNLSIASGAVLTINAGKALSVSGTLTNSAGNTGLVIKSDASGTGSLIHSTSAVPATVERYISGAAEAWHLLSSPVASQNITGDFTPTGAYGDGTGYDTYTWDETTETWLNQKVAGNNITSFAPGQGYLVAYQAANPTKTFTGSLNSTNQTFSLTRQGSSTYAGFNLIGNPFASALTWGTGWTLGNVGAVAYVFDGPTQDYISRSAGDPVPAMNGLMVYLGSGTSQSLTIPAAARTHNTQSWYKSGNERILLVAKDPASGAAKENIIRFNTDATDGFDLAYDGYYLQGFAPKFYSVSDGKNFSVNTLPSLQENMVIPVGFVKTNSLTYSIELRESIQNAVVYLTDKKTGTKINLTENHIYNFTAADGDDANRFSLSFATSNGIHTEISSGMQVYTNNNSLVINQTHPQKGTIWLYNITGQLMRSQSMEASTSQSVSLQGFTPGVYLVTIRTDKGLYNQKVIVNQ